jgi:signal transduction histidine kinase
MDNESIFQKNISETFHADILIVDDKLENLRLLSDFLSTQNYQVRKAVNGQAALTAARALPPDLVLLDINMPGMNGYEVCRQLKSDPKTSATPIIFLSAGNDLEDKVQAFKVGGIDYVTKPFQLEEILARVQTQITIRELQKALEVKNNQLTQALDSLKKAQVTLVQQEKMATLRKVVAGVAHEVNNPLSFIACNISPAKEYINQLLAVIDLYQQNCPNPTPEIKAYLTDLDIEFVTTDLMNILSSMDKGAERIRSVVLALRIFTRLDEAGVKAIDIHESIESTLAVLQHRFSDRADGYEICVKKEYGQLIPIMAYADQLNQVVFNLLCNAIDAIDERITQDKVSNKPLEILIETQLSDEKNSVMIRIRDNGIGISDEIKQHVFEPFFTTKTAGYGLGLGLATSRRIIEEIHGGCLTFNSSENAGTEFIVQIPQYCKTT